MANYHRINHSSRPPATAHRRRGRKLGEPGTLGGAPFPSFVLSDLDGDSPEMELSPVELLLSTIHDAAKRRRILKVRYRDQKGAVKDREIEPYEIKNRGGRLILYAWCRTTAARQLAAGEPISATRTFELTGRFAGFEAITLGEETFEPRWEVKIGPENVDETEETDSTVK